MARAKGITQTNYLGKENTQQTDQMLEVMQTIASQNREILAVLASGSQKATDLAKLSRPNVQRVKLNEHLQLSSEKHNYIKVSLIFNLGKG
jgi:hypothetical protein